MLVQSLCGDGKGGHSRFQWDFPRAAIAFITPASPPGGEPFTGERFRVSSAACARRSTMSQQRPFRFYTFRSIHSWSSGISRQYMYTSLILLV